MRPAPKQHRISTAGSPNRVASGKGCPPISPADREYARQFPGALYDPTKHFEMSHYAHLFEETPMTTPITPAAVPAKRKSFIRRAIAAVFTGSELAIIGFVAKIALAATVATTSFHFAAARPNAALMELERIQRTKPDDTLPADQLLREIQRIDDLKEEVRPLAK